MASAEPRTCSIARTLDIVGEKWALLAIREVFLGDRRFDEMVRRTGAPRDTLTPDDLQAEWQMPAPATTTAN